MPTVTAPHQFFKDERTKLYNWKPDFWRELLQNSIDAGAKNIKIDITEDQSEGRNLLCIEFADDGCGMTLGVLEEVYFALGATTKNDSSSIGGFGRARIMTCFGHEKYEIETLNHFVQGCGASYHIHESYDKNNDSYGNYIDGCKVRVWMEDTEPYNCYGSELKGEMYMHLTDYLEKCSLSLYGIQIKIYGENFSRYVNRGRRVKELSFAKIYVNKSSATFCNQILFRVNGLTMFSRYSNCNKQVIVEIDPDKAREVLSSNRNGFTSSVSNEVDHWFEELAVDDMSALRYRTETRELILGDGYFVSRKEKLLQPDSYKIKTGDDHNRRTVKVASMNIEGSISMTLDNEQSEAIKNYLREPMPGDSFVPNMFNMLVINETCDPGMDAIVSRFRPENWTYEIRSSKGVDILYKRGRESYRLLIAYKVAVQEALRVMVDAYNEDNISWTVGWVFSSYAEGCHLEHDGNHIFCLNPADGKKNRYKLTKKEDLLALIAIAKHEVAHARVRVHNESWGNTLTNIDKRFDTQKVIRLIKEELKGLDV